MFCPSSPYDTPLSPVTMCPFRHKAYLHIKDKDDYRFSFNFIIGNIIMMVKKLLIISIDFCLLYSGIA